MSFMNLRINGRGILAAQYFLYFGVMGMFLPYFNLYCYQIGFSGWQIGMLSTVRSVVTIVFSLLWSLLADRFHTRRSIYILCNFFSAAAWAFFLFTSDFLWMLAITVLYGIFYSPLIAFLEAFAMDVLGRDKKSYGRMRAWGSVAFIISVLTLGRIIEPYGVKIILSLILALSWIQALVAMGFPKQRDVQKERSAGTWRLLLKPRVLVFLLCGFLMLLSHGAYYTFFSIHLSELGYGAFFIGATWATAVCAEIVAMVFSQRIFKRFRYEMVIAFSFGVAVVRWAGLWFAEAAPWLVLLQLTHAVTYGTFHMASILYIDLLTPKEAKTIGQAVNNAVSYGLGLMAGFFISGALYQKIGAHALFGLSGLAALVGGVVFLGHSHMVTKRRPHGTGTADGH